MTDLKVTIREATPADHGMLLLLADECLLPLARRAGHPERYQRSRLLELFRRALEEQQPRREQEPADPD